MVVQIPQPKLWSPRQPALYHANWTLTGQTQGCSNGGRAHARFGIRQLKIEGQYFMLNGKRHFLVGTGDDFGYPGEPFADLSIAGMFY